MAWHGMAVGVPENDVFAAADAVLGRGERPTVERVRLELGRGSPARVGALLDQWWERLALTGRRPVRPNTPVVPWVRSILSSAAWHSSWWNTLPKRWQTLEESPTNSNSAERYTSKFRGSAGRTI